MLQQNVFDPGQQQQTLQQQPQPVAMPQHVYSAPSADYSPVSSPWEGVSRVAQALMSGYRSGHPSAYAAQPRPDFSDTGLGRALGSVFGPSMNY